MQLRITITTEGESFHDQFYPRTELIWVLRQLAWVIEDDGLPDYARPIYDRNGNTCGLIEVIYADER